MQLGSKPPVGVIIDTDFGNRIDDALALAVLYGLDGKNECRVVSVTISKPNLRAAAAAEVIGRFYAGAVSGNFGAIGRNLPIGLADHGAKPEDTAILKGILDSKKYEHGVHSLNDTAEPHAVMRNALTAQFDQNAIVICAGPATNLAMLLDLHGAKSWIERKARYLVIMGGDFSGSGKPESNFAADVKAARKVLAEWPTEIIVAGFEVGSALPFPGASIEKDFAWSHAHPVVDAYRAADTMPYDAGTWDVTAVLQAVRPGEKYFKLSDPGVIQLADNGASTFTAKSGGKHRHLIVDPAQKDRVTQAFVELASAKPVVRAPRRPRPAAAVATATEEAKPPAAVKKQPK
jgi:inosine-uridine nucleoside N-ribohydrolase